MQAAPAMGVVRVSVRYLGVAPPAPLTEQTRLHCIHCIRSVMTSLGVSCRTGSHRGCQQACLDFPSRAALLLKQASCAAPTAACRAGKPRAGLEV